MTADPVSVLPAEIADNLGDPWWRLCHLYKIIDDTGKEVDFSPNEEQTSLVDNLWYWNIILKARQLGFTTLLCVMALDQCLFNKNFSAGIVAHALDDASKIFRNKIRWPYEHLPRALRDAVPSIKMSGSEIVLANGSSIGVGTSMRSGTLQWLHVSEFGKICKKYPEKAREIVTGSFETLAAGQQLFVESTAEGAYGYFHDYCMAALRRQHGNESLTQLDFKLHFFPWWKKPSYTLDPEGVIIPAEFKRYFDVLEGRGIELSPGQRAWYVKKAEILKGDMKREYPSFPEEAFEAVIEGAIYGKEMTWLRKNGRITSVPWTANIPVNTFWDLGKNDANAIWFHQRVGMENRFIRYYENSGYGLRHYVNELFRLRDEEGWVFGRHYLPHDVEVTMLDEDGRSRREILEGLGLKPIDTVERIKELETGIDITRDCFSGVWMDRENCEGGIKALDNYQRTWDETRGCFSMTPLHNWASNGADAFRQYAQGYEGEKTASKARRRSSNWRTA